MLCCALTHYVHKLLAQKHPLQILHALETKLYFFDPVTIEKSADGTQKKKGLPYLNKPLTLKYSDDVTRVHKGVEL